LQNVNIQTCGIQSAAVRPVGVSHENHQSSVAAETQTTPRFKTQSMDVAMMKTRDEKNAYMRQWRQENQDRVALHHKTYNEKQRLYKQYQINRYLSEQEYDKQQSAAFVMPTVTGPTFQVPAYHFGVSSCV
jgi:ribosomal protein L39E